MHIFYKILLLNEHFQEILHLTGLVAIRLQAWNLPEAAGMQLPAELHR